MHDRRLISSGQYDRAAEELIELGALVEVLEPRVFVSADGITVITTRRYAT